MIKEIVLSPEVRYWLPAALLIIICLTARCDYYQVSASDIGWTTGVRQSTTASLDMSGSSIGEGTFQRFTEIKLDDVRMRERIAADNGTLDTSELIHAMAETINPIIISLVKYPGGQNYQLIVNETWPAAIAARRSIDYMGKSISDRDILGDNLDSVAASYLWNKDLRMDREVRLLLKNATFEVLANDATKTIYVNRFLPSKSMDYRINSLSKGMATLRYKQTSDHLMANEGLEIYMGNFLISRHITMKSLHWNSSENDTKWLDCHLFGCPHIDTFHPDRPIVEVRPYGLHQ